MQPVCFRDLRLQLIGVPIAETLDDEVQMVIDILVADRPFTKDNAQARIGFVPQIRIHNVVRLLVDRPLSPAGILRVPGQHSVPEALEDIALARHGRRSPAEDRLRVPGRCNRVDQRRLLRGRVFLGLIDDQKIERFTDAAGLCPGAEHDGSAVFQEDLFQAVLLRALEGLLRIGYALLLPALLGVPGSRQDLHQPDECAVRCARLVGRVDDVLAIHQPPEFAHRQHFAFAVLPRHFVPELRMRPESVLILPHDVGDQQFLPVHRLPAAGFVKLERLGAF